MTVRTPSLTLPVHLLLVTATKLHPLRYQEQRHPTIATVIQPRPLNPAPRRPSNSWAGRLTNCYNNYVSLYTFNMHSDRMIDCVSDQLWIIDQWSFGCLELTRCHLRVVWSLPSQPDVRLCRLVAWIQSRQDVTVILKCNYRNSILEHRLSNASIWNPGT